ncbi:abortive phage infection protein [Streptomyces sp. NPDC087440]|uniref:abortive phage infection protein n=1 Tax=Streptomyces sp. NPDC087440 TaxID=3365790 RepID=UPI0038143B3E
MRTHGISRAAFLTGTAATALVAATGPAATAARATPARPPARHRGLTHHGVGYEIEDGEHPETGWHADRMRRDLRVIADELHASSVSLFGTGVDRFAATASEAAERGLHLWLQPRLADAPHADILDHLAETGRIAERLRRQGARVELSVGCEFVLFVPGIVPGANAVERIKNLTEGNYDPQQLARRLREFIARAARTGRSVFHGPLTYGAAHEDDVDWRLFDVVSMNYYGYHPQRSGYLADLTPYQKWGKPVAVTEFGSCTFTGAPEKGGMGWDSVDYTKDPPEIVGGLVRSERTQAAYLSDLLDVFESLDLYAAQAYQFVSPDAPHRPHDPQHDLDMASYGLVKPLWKKRDRPTAAWHWERKESFHALARHYGRAKGRRS